jgi:hypothetical protein
MRIRHPAVTSDVFKLVSTLEFDLEVNGHFLPTRVELFQDTERPRQFRCRMWERELYHLQLTLSSGGKRKTRRVESDEELLVERTWELSNRFDDFEASSPKAALKRFLDSLKKYLKRVAG